MQYFTTTFLALAALAPTTWAAALEMVEVRQSAFSYTPPSGPVLPMNKTLGIPAIAPKKALPAKFPATDGSNKPFIRGFISNSFINAGNINVQAITKDAINGVRDKAAGVLIDETHGSQHRSCQFDSSIDLNLHVLIKGVWTTANTNDQQALIDAAWDIIADIMRTTTPYNVYTGCCNDGFIGSTCNQVTNPVCSGSSCSCQAKLPGVCRTRTAGRYLPSAVHVGIYLPNGSPTASQLDIEFSSTEKDGGDPGCGIAANIGKDFLGSFLPGPLGVLFNIGMDIACN